MENLKRYNIIPVTNHVVGESLAEYQSPKDKISQLSLEGQLIRLKRGLYSVPRSVTGESLSNELIANHLYGPSYVSYESALSYHGFIPERVYVTRSATLKRSREFDTPIGHFQFIAVPEEYYPIGLIQEIIENRYAFIIATPEKALCDLILHTAGLRLQSYRGIDDYLSEDLRIEPELMRRLHPEIISACAQHGYKRADIQRVATFLNRLNQ